MPVPVVVDCHSHIFNAEDLPIDGFIRRLSPLPSLLTGVLSLPLDRLTAWAAPGSAEIGHIIARLTAAVGPEDAEGVFVGVVPEEADEELVSNAEIEHRLVELWPLSEPADLVALESVDTDLTDLIAQRIAEASPEQLEELAAWEVEWAGADGDTALQPDLEGLGDIFGRAERLRVAALRFVDALRLIARHRFRIAAELAATYPQTGLFVPALVDFSHTTRDEPATSVQAQVAIHSLVAKLSVVGEIPGAAHVRIHPLVGFCPYREAAASELATWDVDRGTPNEYVPYAEPRTASPEDRYRPGIRFDRARAKALRKPVGPWHTARLDIGRVTRSLDIVRHAIELGGFAGVKLYPPGVLPIGNVSRFGERLGGPLDAALRALYGYCDAEDVPILTHAARSNGFEDGFDDLASPNGWQRVLEDFPSLRICFGHFGHLHGIGTDDDSPSAMSWPMRFLALIDRYPNVYADVGNSRYGIDAAYRTRYNRLLTAMLGGGAAPDDVRRKRRRRLMFGSDYWMNTLGADHADFLHSFSAGVESLVGAEARAWFMGGNALRWLGITDEQDLPDTGNHNRQRLVAFYDVHPRPDWLADA